MTIVRKMSPQDESEFVIWAATIPQTAQFNWVTKGLKDSFKKYSCWGLWKEGQLQSVACLLTLTDPWEILWLATRPEAIGQGLMKILLSQILDDARSHRPSRPGSVLLEVHEKNLSALKLYSSLGFIESGRRKNYYIDGASALVLTLKLQ